jgi:hypothetical protein
MKNILLSWKDSVKNHPSLLIVAVIAIISIGVNIALIASRSGLIDEQTVTVPSTTNSVAQTNNATTEIQSPYGVRSETYSKYEDGVWKTSSSTTPLTEDDMKQMRDEFIQRQQALHEYFRKQDELMQSYWEKFWW